MFKWRKNRLLLLVILFVALSFSGCSVVEQLWGGNLGDDHLGPYDMNPALEALEVGDSYGAYTLKSKVWSEDFLGDIYLFSHSTSGGQVAYIAADDDNKWFSAVFKTPATDDTGVNHILEHTVLEGSKAYPIKSPFTELSKRSVNTFMNAMTGSDVTTYPIASENQKDFDNLMRVYLDAVFAPLVVGNPYLLMQEGWRYEKDKEKDKENTSTTARDYALNGVVFNEMRGAMSDRYDWIYTHLPAMLYPDTQYRFNSGGNPQAIIDLTHQQLKKVHQRYYHPQNALLVFYGNLDLAEKMNYVDEQYYADFYSSEASPQEKAEMKTFQAPFNLAKVDKMAYPASEGETPQTDSILSYSSALSNISFQDRIGMELLVDLLCDGYGSPLYDALMDGELGTNFSGSVDATYAQPMLNFLLEGASHEGLAQYEQVIADQLQEVVSDGLDPTSIEGAINQYALSFKDMLNTANRGENALYALELGFVTYDDPLYAINTLAALDEIRERVQEGNYFGDLVDRTLIHPEKTHVSLVVFTPDSELMELMDEAIEQKRKTNLANMTEDELVALNDAWEGYLAYQAKPIDVEAYKLLPTLKVEDLSFEEPEYIQSMDMVAKTPVLMDEVESHGVLSMAMYFNLAGLSEEEFAYLPVLVNLLGLVDTNDYAREDLDSALNRVSSGLSAELIYLQNQDKASHGRAFLKMSNQSLNESVQEMMPLVAEVVNRGIFADKELVEEAIGMALSDAEGILEGEGDQLTLMYQQGGITAAGAMALYHTKEGYRRLTEVKENWEQEADEVTALVAELAEKLLVRARLTVSLAGDQERLKVANKATKEMINEMPKGELPLELTVGWKPELKKISAFTVEPLDIDSQMHYVELGFHLSAIDHRLHGSDLVWMQLLNDGYIYNKVRLEGGAYGGYTGISGDNSVYFSAYRAPDSKGLMDAVKQLPQILQLQSFSQQEVDSAIISVAGRFYQRMDVFAEVDSGVEGYLMPGSSNSQKLLNEMLETKVSYAGELAKWLEQGIDIMYGVDAGN